MIHIRALRVFAAVLTLAAFATYAETDPATVKLWPDGKMPGTGARAPESEVPARGDGFHRITNVSDPTLTVFPVAQSNAPAMIVCPGGGYGYVVIDKEGSEIAGWLNTNGIAAFVLKYRTPNNREGALQDLQRAVSLVRARAGEWKIDPKRLGVIGFSAGGHLSARASTRFGERAYPALDAVDQQNCRPDFAILVYPAYLNGKDGQVSSDLDLQADIPPTLIVHNEDDKSFITGSKVYNAALDRTKVPHAFKCYPAGGHGYGLHCQRDARVWPADALEWLKTIGVP